MKLPHRFFWLAACLTSLATPAISAERPDHPVRIVVPYSTGGTTDYAARLIAQKLSDQAGKTFIVDNKAGASGTIGTDYVAKAAPDGYTLLANDTTYAMLPSLFAHLPWNHETGLVPVTTIAVTPVVLVVPSSSQFQNLHQLVEFARRNPGKLNFGSGGAGSSTHLAAEVFKKDANVSLTHIPYKGAGDAMLAVMSGQVDVLITASPTAMAQVNNGKIRALAVTGKARLPRMANVPTFTEAGLSAYTVTNWFGLAAPKGTPTELVNKLQAQVTSALQDKTLIDRLAEVGAQPGGLTPPAFADFVKEQTKLWSGVAKSAGVRPE